MRRLLAALLLALADPAAADAQAASSWPDGRMAAIALTYDDSLRSHVEVAIPQLDAAGLKGTFFLTGARFEGEITRWREAAAAGHELANHMIYHPCARATFSMPEQYAAENYSVEVMLAEIRTMNDFLTAIDGRTSRAFATPCEQNLAGAADYLGPLREAGLVTHIRDHRAMPNQESSPPVFYRNFDDASAGEMIAWVEQVRRAGGAGIIVFHGVGGDYLSVSADAHRRLLDYLKSRDEIWVAPFTAVMTRLCERRPRPTGANCPGVSPPAGATGR